MPRPPMPEPRTSLTSPGSSRAFGSNAISLPRQRPARLDTTIRARMARSMPSDTTIRARMADAIDKILERDQAVGQGDGRCVDCGEPISPERLEFLPDAARCVRCQAAWEQANRL